MATRADVLQAVAAAREALERTPAVLRRLMRYLDITDGQLAEELGVKRQTVTPPWALSPSRTLMSEGDGKSYGPAR